MEGGEVVTLPHAQLEALARQLCEARRGAGAYDRKGCKRAYWRKLAQSYRKEIAAHPITTALYRACGWKV